jgi:hypothetical protein
MMNVQIPSQPPDRTGAAGSQQRVVSAGFLCGVWACVLIGSACPMITHGFEEARVLLFVNDIGTCVGFWIVFWMARWLWR